MSEKSDSEPAPSASAEAEATTEAEEQSKGGEGNEDEERETKSLKEAAADAPERVQRLQEESPQHLALIVFLGFGGSMAIYIQTAVNNMFIANGVILGFLLVAGIGLLYTMPEEVIQEYIEEVEVDQDANQDEGAQKEGQGGEGEDEGG